MIQSMTRSERQKPDLIDKSRASRIARGSGRKPKDVLDLVGRFSQMRQMMGALGGGAGGGLLSGMPGMGGGLGAMDPAAMMGGGNRQLRRQDASKRKSQQKAKRKQARSARRKGRRK